MGPFKDGWTEADVEAVLERGDPDELLYVPILIGMEAPAVDRRWAEDICLDLAGHTHFNVRGNAILGLAHIARTCGELDLERALPAIARALEDENQYVRGHANDAACDIEIYLDVLVPGYDGEATENFLDAIEELKHKHAISNNDQ